LDQDWVDDSISYDFQEMAKSMRKVGSDGYVRIPEGAPADHCNVMALPDAPVLKYTRKGSTTDNERTCVLKGAASCLSYLGFKRIAFFLCNDLKSGQKEESGFEYFQYMMDPKRLEKKERKAFQFMKLKKQQIGSWDILVDSQQYLMCLVGMHSNDGKGDHAVAVAGKWIFDSNLDYALPLTKESLDLCCSDGLRKSSFVGASQVYMLKNL
jgi:hypothetical protein